MDGEHVPAARLLRAACISRPDSTLDTRSVAAICLAVALVCGATGLALAQAVATPPIPSTATSVPPAPAVAGAPKAPSRPSLSNPAWKDLAPMQQQALSPLATEWDKLDASHKSKWLALVKKFVSMKPDEQARIQQRMRAWVALTPDQRRVARESYARTRKLNTDQKSAQWEQYQQLPDDQKKKLAAEAAKNKVATPPPSQSKPKVVPTLKSATKPVLQESVRPHSGASETLGKPAASAPDASAINPRVTPPVLAAPTPALPAPLPAPSPATLPATPPAEK